MACLLHFFANCLNLAAYHQMTYLGLGHVPAFLCARMTHFGTVLTMLRLVLGTFITTCLTNLCTELAEFRGIC